MEVEIENKRLKITVYVNIFINNCHGIKNAFPSALYISGYVFLKNTILKKSIWKNTIKKQLQVWARLFPAIKR